MVAADSAAVGLVVADLAVEDLVAAGLVETDLVAVGLVAEEVAVDSEAWVLEAVTEVEDLAVVVEALD